MHSNEEIFEHFLPLPYRILLFINLGCWLWLLLLQKVTRSGFNISFLLQFDSLNHSFEKTHESTCYNVTIVSIWSYLSYGFLHTYSESDDIGIIDYLPLITYVLVFYLLLNPRAGVGSKRLFITCKRVMKGSIDVNNRTNDILLSDSLLSYSKSLIDFAIYLCHLINFKTCYSRDYSKNLNRNCGDWFFLDSIIGSIPVFIRLSQCFIEWRITDNSQHLLNFVKYLTNLPMILISVSIKFFNIDDDSRFQRLWFIFALINSSYSFYWDITNDWHFNLFKLRSIKVLNSNNILRPKLLFFQNFNVYYSIIIYDLTMRFLWLTKYLFPNSIFNLMYQTEIGWFCLQLLEIFRRWLWCILRIEVELINVEKDVELNRVA